MRRARRRRRGTSMGRRRRRSGLASRLLRYRNTSGSGAVRTAAGTRTGVGRSPPVAGGVRVGCGQHPQESRASTGPGGPTRASHPRHGSGPGGSRAIQRGTLLGIGHAHRFRSLQSSWPSPRLSRAGPIHSWRLGNPWYHPTRGLVALGPHDPWWVATTREDIRGFGTTGRPVTSTFARRPSCPPLIGWKTVRHESTFRFEWPKAPTTTEIGPSFEEGQPSITEEGRRAYHVPSGQPRGIP